MLRPGSCFVQDLFPVGLETVIKSKARRAGRFNLGCSFLYLRTFLCHRECMILSSLEGVFGRASPFLAGSVSRAAPGAA